MNSSDEMTQLLAQIRDIMREGLELSPECLRKSP
jgi:hypothetical protein